MIYTVTGTKQPRSRGQVRKASNDLVSQGLYREYTAPRQCPLEVGSQLPPPFMLTGACSLSHGASVADSATVGAAES